MKEITTARERVLKNIRNANLKVDKNKRMDIDHESNIYPPIAEDLVIQFAEQFNALGGRFVYCNGERELAANMLAWMKKSNLKMLNIREKSLKEFGAHYQIPMTGEVQEDSTSMASVILAEHLIARTGSIAIGTQNGSGRALPFTNSQLLVIAYADQIVESMEDSLKIQRKKEVSSSFFSYISGPSQTADIEKTLVKGVHGPKEIILFLIETN